MIVVERKFAWLPRIVDGPNNRKAVIWLQKYCKRSGRELGPDGNLYTVREYFCNELGLFSFEFKK